MHTLTYHAHKVHKLTYNAVNAYWELASIKFELLQKLRGGEPLLHKPVYVAAVSFPFPNA